MNFFSKIINLLIQKSPKAQCHICEQIFDDKQLVTVNLLALCSQHNKLYHDTKWIRFIEISSTINKSDAGIMLVEFKSYIWNMSIPSYLTHEYHMEQNEVTTVTNLFIPEGNLSMLQKIISEHSYFNKLITR